MNILYIGQPESDQFAGPSVHIKEVISEWLHGGHSVEYLPSVRVSGNLIAQFLQRFVFALGLWGRFRRSRPDWIFQREQLADPFPAVMSRLAGVNYAIEVNGLILPELKRGRARPWTLLIARACQMISFRLARLVVCPARNWTRILAADYHLPAERFLYVQNGVRLEDFCQISSLAARSQLNIPEDELLVGFLGSVYRNYNFEPFLRAVAALRGEFPQLRVRIVGPGPQRPAVRALIEQLDLTSVARLEDAVPHQQAPQMLAAMDLCLMPYREEVLRENGGMFSMKLQEYAASGRPLIAHDYSGSDSFDDSQRFGWTFEPGDGPGAIRALRDALSSPAERSRRGQAARRYAENLSWAAAAEKISQALTCLSK